MRTRTKLGILSAATALSASLMVYSLLPGQASVDGTIVSWDNGIITLQTPDGTQTFVGHMENRDNSAMLNKPVTIVYDNGDRHVLYLSFPDNFQP